MRVRIACHAARVSSCWQCAIDGPACLCIDRLNGFEAGGRSSGGINDVQLVHGWCSMFGCFWLFGGETDMRCGSKASLQASGGYSIATAHALLPASRAAPPNATAISQHSNCSRSLSNGCVLQRGSY